MPQSFLSDDIKNITKTAYEVFHNSFARQVTAFKIGQVVSIVSSPTYNAFYKQDSTTATREENYEVFYARIKYVKMEEEFFTERDGSSTTSTSSKVILPVGSVKLKVDATGYAYIKDAKRVEFDAKRFAIKHNPRPIAFFSPTDCYEFILIPLDE